MWTRLISDGERMNESLADCFPAVFRCRRKAESLQIGGQVRLLNCSKAVKALQAGHSGYNSIMEQLLNNVGYVLKFDPKMDVKVEFPAIGAPEGSFHYHMTFTTKMNRLEERRLCQCMQVM